MPANMEWCICVSFHNIDHSKVSIYEFKIICICMTSIHFKVQSNQKALFSASKSLTALRWELCTSCTNSKHPVCRSSPSGGRRRTWTVWGLGTEVFWLAGSMESQNGKCQTCRTSTFKCLTALEFSPLGGEEKALIYEVSQHITAHHIPTRRCMELTFVCFNSSK